VTKPKKLKRGDRQDIVDVLVRYASGIDSRDWVLFRTCFTEDVDADYGDIGHWRSADEITAWMQETHAPCGYTLHSVSNHAITAHGDGATARTYIDAIVLGADDRAGVRVAGYYDDELTRAADGWKIARRRFTTAVMQPIGDDRSNRTDAIEAIKRLKARYFRTMDTKDWDAMRVLFADDFVMDSTESGGSVVTGGDACIAFLQETIGDVVTVHHGHMPEIVLTSPTTATGIWAMEDMLRWPNGTELHGYGHYHETYEKVDRAWRITTLRLTRLRMDFKDPNAAER
jgi:3-phenylpropionate/cinnamic acid dioxygenase small subunit